MGGDGREVGGGEEEEGREDNVSFSNCFTRSFFF